MNHCKLGINVDHVATVREARQTSEPDPVPAALNAEKAGADQIVIHLREDRRHIQERDLRLLRQTVQTELNLEMATDRDVIEIAENVAPDQITLVPERRDEVTTEGGLDVFSNEEEIEEIIHRFQEQDIKVSLFIDPDSKQVRAAYDTGADAIELHTGPYAEAKDREKQQQLEYLKNHAQKAYDQGLYVAAGHGLTYHNIEPVVAIDEIQEVNIGHSVVSRSIFVGMKQAVREMNQLINRSSS